jgi:hypothetical protein
MVEYESCLVVTRHTLLSSQDRDIKTICHQIFVTPELPTDPQKLSQIIKPYDAIIGSFPLNLQVQILQNKKALVMFEMKSAGVYDTKEDAQAKASEYPDRATILPPSKEGEKFRVVVYEGLKQIKEIKVIDEWIVQHSD